VVSCIKMCCLTFPVLLVLHQYLGYDGDSIRMLLRVAWSYYARKFINVDASIPMDKYLSCKFLTSYMHCVPWLNHKKLKTSEIPLLKSPAWTNWVGVTDNWLQPLIQRDVYWIDAMESNLILSDAELQKKLKSKYSSEQRPAFVGHGTFKSIFLLPTMHCYVSFFDSIKVNYHIHRDAIHLGELACDLSYSFMMCDPAHLMSIVVSNCKKATRPMSANVVKPSKQVYIEDPRRKTKNYPSNSQVFVPKPKPYLITDERRDKILFKLKRDKSRYLVSGPFPNSSDNLDFYAKLLSEYPDMVRSSLVGDVGNFYVCYPSFLEIDWVGKRAPKIHKESDAYRAYLMMNSTPEKDLKKSNTQGY